MSKDTVRMALHNPAAWPASRTDDADEVIALRGELAELRAKLDAANERARGMAGDLSALAQENAAQAVIIGKLNHTCDELRYQMRLAARADMGQAMRTLRAASTQAGIMVIASDFTEGSISLAEAINRAQELIAGVSHEA